MEEKNRNIFQKMNLITNELGIVAKNLKVENGARSYVAVGERDILDAVKPLEIKYGVYSYPYSREIEEIPELVKDPGKQRVAIRVSVVYRFVNVDNPEDYIEVTSYGDGVDSLDKAPGKAMTYADKYALMKAYKISTGDDPDQEASPSENIEKVVKLATEEQIKRLHELMPEDRFERMLKHSGVSKPEELPYNVTFDYIKKLEKKQKETKA